jgi:processive 1,2-diacylglycerol beta-glucosyltransferase
MATASQRERLPRVAHIRAPPSRWFGAAASGAPVTAVGKLVSRSGRALRVLILTADIGAGHDLPAQLLAEGIRIRDGDATVFVEDGLVAMGPLLHTIARRGAETILQRAQPLFQLEYWLLTTSRPTRWLAARLLALVGGRGLLRLIAAVRPDVIVSTYPGTTQVLGALRRSGRLGVPCVGAITDLAALRYWAHAGIDVHLVIHAESRAEVLEIAGARAVVRHVRGLSRPEFEDPPPRAEARSALGLAGARPLVLVSGGGWGIGDVAGAARAARRVGAEAVCVCGTNADLRKRLERVFAADPHVRVQGFTDTMCAYLAAADVLVHSTGGLTVLEAQMCGCWAISYGWNVAHIRANNRAYARFGLAAVADTPAALETELRRALEAPRPRDRSFARLPHAADVVLDLTRPARATPAR